MSDSSSQRSEEFLKIADQFQLGHLVTEGSHPVTQHLSEVAKEDIAAALKLLFKVDEDVSRKFSEIVASGQMNPIADKVGHALQTGGRIFFTGCGSTGRLSILLDSIWRHFWQERTGNGFQSQSTPPQWENRTFSVMAGGDFALIKAVEGFEDYTEFGRKQIRDLGVRAGDVVFAITEGGETSFVIGTVWEGVDAGAQVYFVYNNPDDTLCQHVERSREVILDSRIEKLNLTTGPMAISGSTRMQATSIQLCVLLTILEMVIRRLLADTSSQAPAPSPDEVPEVFANGLNTLMETLQGDAVLEALASVVRAESECYSRGGRANYVADHLAIDVLTDTTERSPTFCTPPFRKYDDTEAAESMAFLFLPGYSTESAWNWILKRTPNCLRWSSSDVSGLIPDDKLNRAAATLGGITTEELLQFRIGADGLPVRPIREEDLSLFINAPGECADVEDFAKAGYATLSFVNEHQDSTREQSSSSLHVEIRIPEAGLLLDGLTRVAVKMVLNAVSTCVMVRLGRVMGNTMIYVVPSNLKLIDRATRYISRLTGQDYPQSNRLLFETIEYVEPRMLAGKTYPPVVGLAVLRERKGLTFQQAESELQESGLQSS